MTGPFRLTVMDDRGRMRARRRKEIPTVATWGTPMELMRLGGWILLALGGLLVLGAVIAVLVFVFIGGAKPRMP